MIIDLLEKHGNRGSLLVAEDNDDVRMDGRFDLEEVERIIRANERERCAEVADEEVANARASVLGLEDQNGDEARQQRFRKRIAKRIATAIRQLPLGG